MNVVLLWLSQQAFWVYPICLLGALAYGMMAISATRRREMAQFSLEREVYQQRSARSWLMSVLFLALGGAVFVVQTFILPPAPVAESATPTIAFGLLTPTPTAVFANTTLTSTEVVTSVVVASPDSVLAPTSVTEPTAVPSEWLQPVCPHPEAQLTLPVAGSNLSGLVEVQGTANVNAFAYYRFEVHFPGADTPSFISQYDIPVENGLLGAWDISDPTRYPPGTPYRFQLVVVDIYGNTTTCTIPLSIVSPEE